MKRIELQKFGFVRAPELDFSDDGNRFTCYTVGNVRVSKTTWNGEVFLAGRIEDSTVPWDIYSQLPHYKALDKLNGVSIEGLTEQDIKDLFNACVEYSKEYAEAKANLVYPTVEELKVQYQKIKDHNIKLYEEATKLLKDRALELLMSNSWRLSSLKHEYEVLKNRANADVEKQAKDTYGSSWSFNVVKPTNRDLTDTYYLDELKEDIEKILAQ